MLGHKKAGTVAGATTLVSSDTTVVGDLHFAGNLDIEGLVQGEYCCQSRQGRACSSGWRGSY